MNQYYDEPTFEPGKSPGSHTPSPQFPHPINSRYRCIGLLGHGSGGAVYRAYDRHLHREVAIKFIHQHNISERRRLLAEARLLAQLDHPHVCKVYEVVEEGDAVYLVMSFIDGTHLGQWAQRFSTENSVLLIAQIADALASAHSKSIVHCDVKPNNIVLKHTEDGGMDAVLVDFGVAHSNSNFVSPAAGGTRYYMAPERLADPDGDLAPAVDIYSLGATLLYMLTGQPDVKKIDQFRLSDDLRRIILNCTDPEAERRYSNAARLRDDLHAWLNTKPISLRRSPLYKAHRSWQRSRWLRGTSFAALALTILLAITAAVYQDTMQQRQLEQIEIRELVAHTESQIDAIYRSPVHNTRPALEQLHQQAEHWRDAARGQPDWLGAASNAAAGRIFYQLNEIDKALEALTAAWELGDRSGATAMALAQVYQRLYIVAQAQARNHANQETRERALEKARLDFQRPALDFLNQARDSRLPPAYVNAMRAFLEGDETRALTILHSSAFPTWFYQRHQLIADIQRANFFDSTYGFRNVPQDQALADLEKAYTELVALVPSYYYSYREMASVYHEAGVNRTGFADYERQMRHNLEKMYQLDPGNPYGHYLHALIERRHARNGPRTGDRQLQVYNGAMRQHELSLKEARARNWPEQHQVRLLMGALDTLVAFQISLGNSGKPASSVLHRFFTLMHKVPEAHRGARYHIRLGAAHYAMAREFKYDQRATEHLEIGSEAFLKARQIAPTIAGMHGNHASALVSAAPNKPRPVAFEMAQVAVEAIDKAYEIKPNDAAIVYNRGRAYLVLAENAPLASAQAEEAIQIAHDSFLRSLELFPGLDFSRDQLADIYHFYGELLVEPLSVQEALQRSQSILQIGVNEQPELTLQRHAEWLRFSTVEADEDELLDIAAQLKVIGETLRERDSIHTYPVYANSLLATAQYMAEPHKTEMQQLANEYYNKVPWHQEPQANIMFMGLHVRMAQAGWMQAKSNGGDGATELQHLQELCTTTRALMAEDSYDNRRLWELLQAWQASDKATGLECSGQLGIEIASVL